MSLEHKEVRFTSASRSFERGEIRRSACSPELYLCVSGSEPCVIDRGSLCLTYSLNAPPTPRARLAVTQVTQFKRQWMTLTQRERERESEAGSSVGLSSIVSPTFFWGGVGEPCCGGRTSKSHATPNHCQGTPHLAGGFVWEPHRLRVLVEIAHGVPATLRQQQRPPKQVIILLL